MMARLGDLCDILNGYAFKSEQYVDSGIRIIRIANVQKGYIEDSTPVFYQINNDEYKKYELYAGDLLISLTGNVGRVALLQKEFLPAALNQRVACLRIKDESVLNKSFLFSALDSDYFENKCIESSKGVAQKNMSTEWLKEYDIPLFSMKEQLEISHEIETINNLISLRKQQLSKLDELVKSRFIEMFGRLGHDDKGWGLTTLGQSCELNPKRPKGIADDVYVSFVPMPAVSEKGHMDCSTIKPYSEVKKGFTYFEENDVLFAKITPCMENGKGAIAKGLSNGIGAGSTEFHVLRPIAGRSNPYWLYIITMFDEFRTGARKVMTGTGGQLRVPISYLSDYPIALPPIGLQDRFESIVKQSDKSKFEIQKSLEKLETLKKALMQKYFG